MKIYRTLSTQSIQMSSKILKIIPFAVGMALVSNMVFAAAHDPITKGEGATANNYGIAVGYKANAGIQAIAMGKDSKAKGNFAVALGDGTKAEKLSVAAGKDAQSNAYSTAIGWLAKATGEVSNAIGYAAEATALRATAIGPDAKTKGARSLSLGNDVQTHKDRSFSIGSNIHNHGTHTTVIGDNIRVSADNSIILGHESAYTERSDSTGGIGDIGGRFAATNAKGVLSVGSRGNERRIQNVAAGLVSKHSTDAINGSQLYATNERIEHINKELKAGIASAMAFKETPFVPGKWSYAAGAAHYGSEQAVAVSFGRTAESGNWSLSGGISKGTRGDVGFRVGVSGVFN